MGSLRRSWAHHDVLRLTGRRRHPAAARPSRRSAECQEGTRAGRAAAADPSAPPDHGPGGQGRADGRRRRACWLCGETVPSRRTGFVRFRASLPGFWERLILCQGWGRRGLWSDCPTAGVVGTPRLLGETDPLSGMGPRPGRRALERLPAPLPGRSGRRRRNGGRSPSAAIRSGRWRRKGLRWPGSHGLTRLLFISRWPVGPMAAQLRAEPTCRQCRGELDRVPGRRAPGKTGQNGSPRSDLPGVPTGPASKRKSPGDGGTSRS